MKKLILFSVLLLLPAGLAPRWGAAQEKDGLSKIMAKKLKNSQLLLEGLAMGNFAKITRAAEELIQLTKTEEWMVHKTPRYEVHSNEFRRAAETVVQKAGAKNLDGAALAYFDMTMSCLRCHQYVRELRDARLRPPPQGIGLAE